MKIAVVSKSDRNGGGASRVAEDLATWLNEAGHSTDHYTAFRFKQSPKPFQKSVYGRGRRSHVCKSVHNTTYRYGFPELLPIEYWVGFGRHLNQYDVVHFHDLYTSISPFSLALSTLKKPTFMTVHDCSAFTGGCLYPLDCQQYKTHCHSCPQLPLNSDTGKPIPDRTRSLQTIKRQVAKHCSVRYLFPSAWMARQASFVFENKVPPAVVPNGLDLSLYHRMVNKVSKHAAKTQLEIDSNRPTVTISAHCLDDPRKGVKYAILALQSIRELSPLVLTIGFIDDELRQALAGLEVRAFGYVEDPQKLASIYLATDVLLFCTLADNLPLTVLEAMAASAVVISFATGGVPEIIKSGHNGILIEPANQEALNSSLREWMRSPQKIAIGKRARETIESNFTRHKFIEQHLQIYKKSIHSSL